MRACHEVCLCMWIHARNYFPSCIIGKCISSTIFETTKGFYHILRNLACMCSFPSHSFITWNSPIASITFFKVEWGRAPFHSSYFTMQSHHHFHFRYIVDVSKFTLFSFSWVTPLKFLPRFSSISNLHRISFFIYFQYLSLVSLLSSSYCHKFCHACLNLIDSASFYIC